MRPLLSAEQMREFDSRFIQAGVAGCLLMENAGRGAAHLIGLKVRPRVAGTAPRTGSNVVGTCVRCADERSLEGVRVLILAGGGNNGGDGFVVARHLASRAAEVRVFSKKVLSAYQGDALMAAKAMVACGVPLRSFDEWDATAELKAADVVVDAVYGTGLNRELSDEENQLFSQINDSKSYVIALDVPSGLHASSGKSWGTVITAAHTVCFAHLKSGLFTTTGMAHGGNITLSHIGVPSALQSEQLESAFAFLLEEQDVLRFLPARESSSHKVNNGRVLIAAGAPGTVGAARLCSRAALRAGAGVVTLLGNAALVQQLEGEVQEVMTRHLSLPLQQEAQKLLAEAASVVVGPGMGQSQEATDLMCALLLARRPTVVDADALRFIAGRGRAFFIDNALGAHCVFTPHPGEAAALLGISSAELEQDRFSAAQALAKEYGTTILLKGPRSIVAAPGRRPWVSAFGSAALATAGSGDVLAGLLAAMLVGAEDAQLIFERSLAALGLQGLAAQRWSAEHGERGLLASEIGDLVPQVIASLLA